MNVFAGILGAVAGTMSDPLVIGAGIASYFIARRWGGLPAAALVTGLSALALFALISVLAQSQQIEVPNAKLAWLFLAISAWAGISYGTSLLFKPGPPDISVD